MNAMNRRDFLKKSTKGVAALAAGAAAIKAGWSEVAASDVIRIAVIGVNGRGQAHVKAFRGIKGVQVVALCDPDQRVLSQVARATGQATGKPPKTYVDIRELLKDKEVDAVSIATTNHWHSLATIWACQAGKDVYVEKPASHNIFEGRKMVEAARKYNRIVQVGSQGRSAPSVRKAMELLHGGAIGDVFMARALCFKRRDSIGFKPDEAPPADLSFDLWLGPAPQQSYNGNFVHYNWHWFWDFGNGDIGNQGVHQMDTARWGLGKGHAVKANSAGGRYGYKDQGQTPNTQTACLTYDDGKILVFDVRGRDTNDEAKVGIGNLFYGSKGWLAVYGTEGPYDLFLGDKKEPEPRERGEGFDHFENFIEAVRKRDPKILTADVEEGHISAALCHLANIAHRLGRTVTFDPKTETFPGDAEANELATRVYRPPFVVPEKV
jgi:predicted dehydrogenase